MTEETFEERFPSLKGKIFWIDWSYQKEIFDDKEGKFIKISQVRKHTIDKSIVERDYVSKEKLIKEIEFRMKLSTGSDMFSQGCLMTLTSLKNGIEKGFIKHNNGANLFEEILKGEKDGN